MTIIKTLLANPIMQDALKQAKEELPSGETWSDSKQAVVVRILEEMAAIVELLQEELAGIAEPEARAAKVAELKDSEIKNLVALYGQQFSGNQTYASTALCLIALAAISILTKYPPR